ncbi:GNAT family N-acetyltransferase [Brevibacterium sp. CFH 10365]|uniref:GNAT family N-acetyltransferase n=1 Tax=Brevibacterium sp. CFH 10365 TaxID=2585207 RepID=UPI001D0CF1C9|nr:GNAT family N-acetyltransferase [Brevibacterium sp. CFH 10365]
MIDLNGQSSPGDQPAMRDQSSSRDQAGVTAVEIVWGLPMGLGPLWQGVPSGPGISGVLPPRSEVEALYGAAAAEPPLNEDPRFAARFADVYEVSVRKGQVLMTLTRAQADGRLSSFAYGHHWRWEEQKYPWAFELQSRLGEASVELESTFALNLLARDPNQRARGVGRRTLDTWIGEVSRFGCWLQTDDIDSPARRLYESLGFTELGHGPEAPDGRPGLVMFRASQ